MLDEGLVMPRIVSGPTIVDLDTPQGALNLWITRGLTFEAVTASGAQLSSGLEIKDPIRLLGKDWDFTDMHVVHCHLLAGGAVNPYPFLLIAGEETAALLGMAGKGVFMTLDAGFALNKATGQTDDSPRAETAFRLYIVTTMLQVVYS